MRTAFGRLRAGWRAAAGTGIAASLSLTLLVLASVFVAVAGARASVNVPTRALRAGLAAMPRSQQAVFGGADYNEVPPVGPPVSAGQLTAVRGLLSKRLAQAGLPLAASGTDWSGLTTGYAMLTAGGHKADNAGVPPRLQFVYRDSLSHYARRITGALPDAGRRGDNGVLLQVAVTAATARRFGLTVGSHLQLGAFIAVVVTGIITPVAANSAFWSTDPVAAVPSENAPGRNFAYWQGALFVGPAELGLLESGTDLSAVQLSWGFPADLRGLTAGQAGVLQGLLSGQLTSLGQLSVNPPLLVSLSAGFAGLLNSFTQERAAVAGILDLLLVSLAAIGVVIVLLGTLMLAEQRRGEFTLLRARGAGPWQRAALATGSVAVVAVPAAAAGAGLAVVVTPGATGSLAWWLGGLTLLAALAGFPLFAARGQRSGTGAGRRAPDRRALRRQAAARRLVIEAALIAAAVAGLFVARQQGGSGLSPDLLTSAAPVLAAIPAAIVALRCYPLLARGLLRAAGLRRGVVAYVGLARAARSSVTSILPAFALVLVLVMVAFGGMVRGAITRGEVAASWQRIGADAAIDTSDSSLPLTAAAQRAIAAVPGVTRTAAITMTTGTQSDGTQIAVAIVSPRQYAALIAATPGPPFPAAALSAARSGTARSEAAQSEAARGGRVPALATTGAASALGAPATELALGDIGRNVAIRVVGTAVSDPAIAAAAGGPLVVLPRSALGRGEQPNLMLVTGPDLDGRQLAAVVGRVVPGAVVGLRSSVLGTLAGAPLPHATYVAYAVGVAVAAGFGILVLLIALLVSADSRQRTLARLAAMGLSTRQGSWLVLVETLPEILVAAACGIGCAWALAVVVGPDLNLTPFTGSGAGVQVRPEPAVLAIAAAGLLVVAVGTLAGQAIIAGRRGVARSLRMGE
jgi:putative ABC transport system permease protein